MQYPQQVTSYPYNRFQNGGRRSNFASPRSRSLHPLTQNRFFFAQLSHCSFLSSSFPQCPLCGGSKIVQEHRFHPAESPPSTSSEGPPRYRPDWLAPAYGFPLSAWEVGRSHGALDVVDSMEKSGYELEETVYNYLGSCCIRRRRLEKGDWLRKHMIRACFDPPGVFMDNRFINLYMKCGKPSSARHVFDAMPKRNLVSWNAMISGYCSNGFFSEALELFREMCLMEAVHPNQLTCISAIISCGGFGDSSYCYQIHSYVIKKGFVAYGSVGNALVTMYGKLGLLEEAEAVFSNLLQRDEVSWNALISVNSRSQHCDRAVTLFARMQQEGIRANEYAFGSVLKSCADSRNGTMDEQIHSLAIKSGFSAHPIVGTALLDVYAKCTNFADVKLIFDNMPERNMVSWNIVIGRCMERTRINDGLRHPHKLEGDERRNL